MGMFGNTPWKFPTLGDLDPTMQASPQPQSGFPQIAAPQPSAPPSWMPQIPAVPPEKTGFNKPGGWAEKLGAIGGILQSYGGRPNDAYDEFIQRNEQRRQALLAQRQQALKAFQPQDVGGNLVRLNPQTGAYESVYSPPAKPTGPHYFESNDGSQWAVGEDGQPKLVYKDPDPKIQVVANGDGTFTRVPLTGSVPGLTAPATGLPPGYTVRAGGSGPGQGGFQPSVSALWPFLNKQESSGNYSAVGPSTPYGQALGGNQLMPATAKGMAAKLNLPWRPDLLTDSSPTGKQYQDLLGQAYLQQGYEATGNWRDALRYYHGGPDRRLWGPKTNGYADKILSRAGLN